jgi:hypothetical protein
MLKEETVPSSMPMTKNASATNAATTSTPQSMRNIILAPATDLPAGWISGLAKTRSGDFSAGR